METKTTVGYRVKTSYGSYVYPNGIVFAVRGAKPAPVSHAEAHQIAADYISRTNPDVAPSIVKVVHTLTPLEATSRDLGKMLTSLLGARGVTLGLSQDQIEKQIAKELTMLGGVSVARFFR